MTSISEQIQEARLMLDALDSIPGTTCAQAVLLERLRECLDAIRTMSRRESL